MMKLVVKLADKSLEFEGESVSDAQLRDVLSTFLRIIDPGDETVSDGTVDQLRQKVERVEELGEGETNAT